MANASGGVPPDIYFAPGYGAAVARVEDSTWVSIVLADGDWQLPLLVRTLPSGRKDAVSPYGYSGVYRAPGISELQAAALWATARAQLLEMDVVSIFVRESPLVDQATRPPDAVPVVTGHPIFHVPCQGNSANWDAMQGRARTSIRKAERLGTLVEIRRAERQDLEAGSSFRRLYESTMSKVDAGSYYYFGDDYYNALVDGLSDDLLICQALDSAGHELAASLFLQGPSTLHYHLSGSTLDGSRGGAVSAILWAAIQYANKSGLDGVLLGGGVHEGDGLERFKRSFGGNALMFNAYGLIIDQDAYNAEVASMGRRLGLAPRALTAPGFFPAYRRKEAS